MWNYQKENRSGNFRAENTLMNKTRNHCLHYHIIEATSSVISRYAKLHAFYAKKYVEIMTHQQKRVLALTSRKFFTYAFGTAGQSQLRSVDKNR